MQTILICLEESDVTTDERAEIARCLPNARLIVTNDKGRIAAEFPNATIITGMAPRALIGTATSVRWLQQWSAGSDWLLSRPELIERDFLLTTASGVHAIGMSEHLLAVMLAFARQLPLAQRAQLDHQWLRRELVTFELAGKTLLLVGVGAIGARTARLAHALDMRVIGIRRHPDLLAEGVDIMAGPGDLHRWLPEADFTAVTAPHTHETHHLIGAAELALIRPDSYLLNVGRGKTVDEAALIAALQSGRLAGAGLDVFEQEPLPADSPLWVMANVIVTPHNAGIVPNYSRRAMALFLDNLRRYAAGLPLRNLVDRQLGY